MEVKELKNKLKIVFPPESEIFMAEEFLAAVAKAPLTEKDIEADLSDVSSIDTVFLQIAISLCRTAKDSGHSVTLKTSEAFDKALTTYGISPDELTGGNK